jgi:predicted SprT family Zn-dependent metalloprotease
MRHSLYYFFNRSVSIIAGEKVHMTSEGTSQLSNLEDAKFKRMMAVWSLQWSVGGFEESIEVVWGNRLKTTLGRAYPERNQIRLNRRLLRSQEVILQEALCHEYAHIVVYKMWGRDVRPHGKEWQSLMLVAEIVPRVGIPIHELGEY